ncbi:MAG: dehalogenase [Dehalogenimonas sp.]
MWYWIGLILGLALMFFGSKMNRAFKFKWYDWIFGIAILVLLTVGAQHYFGSASGFESKAGWIGLAIFGGLAVILAVVEWRILEARQKKAV